MFLKNKNIIFKIRRSKVTDYAALTNNIYLNFISNFQIKSALQQRNLEIISLSLCFNTRSMEAEASF